MARFLTSRNWLTGSMNLSINALTVMLLAVLLQMVVQRSTLAQSVTPDAAPDAAQIATTDIRVVHRFYPSEWSIPQRAGLAYSLRQNQFFLIRQGKSGSTSGSTIAVLTSYGKLAYNVPLNFTIDDALNVAFDDSANRLLLLNRSPAELIAIPVAANGKLDPNAIQRVSVSGFGLRGADSMDVDPQLGRLYILDDTGAKILVANLSASLSAVKVTNTLNLTNIRPNKFRGIAVNPASHNVFVMTHSQRKLLELSPTGELLNSYDLTKLNLTQPRDMVFAPSADLTDAADTLHLYITDSRETAVAAAEETTALPQAEEAKNPIFLPLIQNNSNGQLSEQQEQLQDPAVVTAAKAPRLGELLEVALEPLVTSVQASAANVESLQLLRTVDMSTYSPPSPDPSGITYLPNSNTLLMTDGEVEETVTGITHFAGANVWELTLAGNPVRTANISKVAPTLAKITNEPTGIAWNPNNNHYYVTDDDALRVYDINPGADNLIGTADDSWTFFDTSAVNDVDPEGITYDIATDRLFVSDGINKEIYQYTTDGVYVGQFDVEQYGVSDPESVEYNPESATLYVLSNVDHQIIVEVTPAGALLRTFDASAMQGIAPAGLAYAPASDGSGVKHFYIIDRGIDNNADPNIIDGRMFEMTAPDPLPPGTNMPPLVDAGQDLNVTLPAQGTLSGVVTDDGLPNPPNSLTITWSQLSGPGLVTFANPHSTQTSVAFTLPGSYIVRLSANDGEYIGSDDLNVTVSGPASVTALNIPINSGSDDAEENSSNSMSLTSTDLDMMLDSGGTPAITMLAIGLRFNGITIPPGATIVNAYLQFVVDEVHTDDTQFVIQGQATDNAPTFASSKRSITSRALTTASVQWVPELWSTVGQSGPAQRSPNLNAIIQEIVNRLGWSANNSLALILTGSGQRVAKSYEAGAANAPVLHIEYNLSSPPTSTPTATNTPIPATATPTATATNTPIPATVTPTSTATNTPVPATATPTGTPIPATATPTSTATNTPIPATATPTATATNTPIPATATATNTPVPATVTPTSTPSATATNTPIPPTATPTSTATATATSTPTSTPTSTSAVTVTRTIAPSADVRVQDNTPTTNYGKSPELRIRSTGPVYRSYLRFTVTGVTGTVQRARIRLYVVDASTMGGSIYLTSNNYVNTTTPWTETGLIWNNAPGVTGSPLSTLGAVALNTWVEFDVTSAVQSNGTYNFALTSTATNAAYYSTKEDTAHPPVLVLDIAP